MSKISIYIIVNCILFSKIATAQNFDQKGISGNYFRFPLDIPMSLAANFGECRTDHFHMGLDIRTNQKENYPVYAAAEGYISRVFINKNGFGRAIYIKHPNGYTTVYAHLNNFYPALQEYVVEKQYAEQQWEQDFTLDSNQFPVYKSQFIAYSGNTGSSEGPHVHFETRDSKTDENINPIWFIHVSDSIKPTIFSLVWYDRDRSTYEQKPSFIPLKKTMKGLCSVDSVVEMAASNISFGIIASDKSNTSSFDYGIYKATVYADLATISQFQLNRISYANSRYINSCIDYSYKANTNKYIQYLFPLPGNRLPYYFTALKNKGIINLGDDSVHSITITVADFNGNNNTISLHVKRKQPVADIYYPLLNKLKLEPNKIGILKENDIQVVFPEKALYDTLYLSLSRKVGNNVNAVSSLFSIGTNVVPLHINMIISIKSNQNLTYIEKNKTIIQYLSGKMKKALKPIWTKDWAEVSYNNLGNFQLIIDTVPPTIHITGIRDSSNISSTKKIMIKAIDTEGEVQHFKALLDGKWLLFYRKGDYFVYDMDIHCAEGSHILTCSIEDIAGNVSVKTISFFRNDTAAIVAAKKLTQKKDIKPAKKKKAN